MMIKKFFTVAVLATTMVACGNAEEGNVEENAAEETVVDDHAGHNHDGTVGADAETYTAPEGAYVFFANLNDGDTVTSPVMIDFGVEGMAVNPAGEIVPGTGHHHIIIDGEATPQGTAVPADDTHIHYGGGQTQAKITLTPGKHTLIMQFANGIHQSFGKQMSATITVYVK